jgi:hypothetical protein
MPIITPHHQFEIRYTAILDFPNIIRKPISPFVKFAKKITVDNEGSHNERITLSYDDEYYQIIINWDRIILRFEGDKENLGKNNSIIEEPFFNIFKKIREQDNFGEINNTLYYSFIINPIKIEHDELLRKFKSKYLTNYQNIVEQPTDIAVTLENKIENKQITITFGPYFGNEDLKKRNIFVKNPIVTNGENDLGICMDLKILNITKTVNFNDYKELTKIESNYLEKLWVL